MILFGDEDNGDSTRTVAALEALILAGGRDPLVIFLSVALVLERVRILAGLLM